MSLRLRRKNKGDHILKNDIKIISNLISVANSLDQKGFFKEADAVDLLTKEAYSLNVKRFKILFKKALDKLKISNDLDTSTNRWGKINQYFKQLLLNAGATEKEAAEASTNWAGVAHKWGPDEGGYRPTLEGMLDLIQDYTKPGGGSALIGIKSIGPDGGGGLNEDLANNPELRNSLRFQRLMADVNNILDTEDERRRDSLEWEDARRSMPRVPAPVPATKSEPSGVEESGAMANLPDNLGGTFGWGEWQQKRDSTGAVTGYRRKGDSEWMSGGMFESDPRTMSTAPVGPRRKAFRLGLGGDVGERSVANIGRRPLLRNMTNWNKVSDQ